MKERPWIFFLVFCCCSKVIVCWFRLHTCVSSYILVIIWIWEMNIKCSYIYTSNIGISKHERHLRLLSSGTKLFITFEFKGFRHKERDTHSFYSGFFIAPPPPQHVWHPPQRPLLWLRRASESQPSSPEAELHSTNWLFQNPKILRTFPVRDVIRTCYPRFPSGLLWHLWVTRPLRPARVNTCVNVAPK